MAVRSRLSVGDVEAALNELRTTPSPAAGLGERFGQLAREFPGRLALVDEAGAQTFAEVDADANRLAAELSARGIQQGDRLALLVGNRRELFTLAIAAWKLGALPVPLSANAPPAELAALHRLATPRLTIAVDDTGGLSGAVSLDELSTAAAERRSAFSGPALPTTPWKAIASGGSTGRPKLIVTHENGPTHPAAAALFGMRPGGVQVVAGPVYHNGPFAWGTTQLMAGGTVVLMSRFDPEQWLQAIARHRATWCFVVPTMLHRVLALPPEVLGAADLSSLEVVLHSAAPCPATLKRAAIELFGADRLWEYYGSTEVPGTLIRGDEWLLHPGSVGRPVPHLGIEILDEQGTPVPPGEVGEIHVRPMGGPSFEYVGADATATGDLVSVGDLGYLDEDGYLYISDRRTDLIISGGANIYPAEVEAALFAHPGVADAAVIGLPHPDWGHQVHAVVELAAGAAVSAEELRSFCREHLAPYKVPKTVEIVDQLPRADSGKLRRAALRDERVVRT
jgi:bile acid-coenzyme A ligase